MRTLGTCMPPKIFQVCSHLYLLWKSQWLTHSWVTTKYDGHHSNVLSHVLAIFFLIPSLVWIKWNKVWNRLLVSHMRSAGIFSNEFNLNLQLLQSVSVQRGAAQQGPDPPAHTASLEAIWNVTKKKCVKFMCHWRMAYDSCSVLR